MKTLTSRNHSPTPVFFDNLPANLELIRPSLDLSIEFLAYAYECLRRGHEQFIEPINNIRAYFEKLRREEYGIDLPDDQPSASEFWLVRDDCYIVGSATLRHSLNDFYNYQGGHIDLVIRPSLRQQGYTDILLAQTLLQARNLNLHRVLLTCDSGNPVAEVFLNNGARLENKVIAYDSETLISRYWVDLGTI